MHQRVDWWIHRPCPSAGWIIAYDFDRSVENVKTETSKWAKKAERGNAKFTWQAGYGAFSVSHSLRHAVDRYIRNQAEHHTNMSFKDEYRQICEKHEIEIDERYVWD